MIFEFKYDFFLYLACFFFIYIGKINRYYHLVNFETICPFLSCANISETCVFFFSFVTLFCKWCFMGFSRLPFGRCGLPFGFHFRGPDPYNDLFSKRELRTAFTDATVPGPDDILSGRDEDEEGLPTTDPNL